MVLDSRTVSRRAQDSDRVQRVPMMVLMAVACLIAAASMAAMFSKPQYRDQIKAAPSMQDEAAQIEQGSVAALVWEMRSGVSDILWLKTDEYMHDGIPHARGDEDSCVSGPDELWASGYDDHDHDHGLDHDHDHDHDHGDEHDHGHDHSDAHESGDDHDHAHAHDAHGSDPDHAPIPVHVHGESCNHGHDHDRDADHAHHPGDDCGHEHGGDPVHTATAAAPRERIPFAREARPWQGVLGKVSEQTTTVGEHRHTKNKEELLPWFRLATLMNPHHIRAYRVGAFWLATYVRDVTGAMEFAMEGLAKNPNDPEMAFVVGRIHFYEFKDYEAALPYFQQTIQFGMKIPADVRTDLQRLAILDGYRHTAYCHKAMGNIELAWQACQRGLKGAPRDIALQNYSGYLGELLASRADAAPSGESAPEPAVN